MSFFGVSYFGLGTLRKGYGMSLQVALNFIRVLPQMLGL